jgi:hypothetical protein
LTRTKKYQWRKTESGKGCPNSTTSGRRRRIQAKLAGIRTKRSDFGINFQIPAKLAEIRLPINFSAWRWWIPINVHARMKSLNSENDLRF